MHFLEQFFSLFYVESSSLRLDCYRGWTVIEAGLLSRLDCFRGWIIIETEILLCGLSAL